MACVLEAPSSISRVGSVCPVPQGRGRRCSPAVQGIVGRNRTAMTLHLLAACAAGRHSEQPAKLGINGDTEDTRAC